MMNLSVKIGKLRLRNPVTVASGTFGYTEEHYHAREMRTLGAFIPKTVTLHAREGNPAPRIVETAAGMLNAIGLENDGVDAFIETKLPALRAIHVPLIISISGNTDKEFVALARKLNGAQGVSAIELNLSCPNLGKKTVVAQDPKATARVVKAVKKVSRVPVIAKLSPNVTDITVIARSAEDAGADGVSMVNTFAAMAIDSTTQKLVLGHGTGGLSGPAIKPIALAMVYAASQKVRIPIIAMGGIMNADDAIEFIIAGAAAVAVGTGNFINPRAPLEVLSGIQAYMKKHRIQTIKQLCGKVRRP